jgi:predicted nucleotidyltransferase
MTREQAISKVQAIQADLVRFDVKSLSLFGSVARGESRAESDIDFIVEFNGRATFDNYFGLLVFLEDALETKVDLVHPDTLRTRIRDRVLAEAVRVA